MLNTHNTEGEVPEIKMYIGRYIQFNDTIIIIKENRKLWLCQRQKVVPSGSCNDYAN